MTPGERLQLWRKKQGIQASVLALRIGVSQATISNFECGKTRISSEALSHLHELGVDIDWLLCGEGGMDCYSNEFMRHIISIAEELPEYRLEQLYHYAEYLRYLEEKSKSEKRDTCKSGLKPLY